MSDVNPDSTPDESAFPRPLGVPGEIPADLPADLADVPVRTSRRRSSSVELFDAMEHHRNLTNMLEPHAQLIAGAHLAPGQERREVAALAARRLLEITDPTLRGAIHALVFEAHRQGQRLYRPLRWSGEKADGFVCVRLPWLQER